MTGSAVTTSHSHLKLKQAEAKVRVGEYELDKWE